VARGNFQLRKHLEVCSCFTLKKKKGKSDPAKKTIGLGGVKLFFFLVNRREFNDQEKPWGFFISEKICGGRKEKKKERKPAKIFK